jgi:hypothetical protein
MANQSKPNHGATIRSTSASSISEVVSHGQTKDKKSWHNYATVTESVATKIKQDGGPDIRGYTHRIEAGIVRKILRKHSTDPLPITKDDFEKLPEIVSSPDLVAESPKKTGTGLAAIQYEKRCNGTTFVVEEVRTGHGRLALKTMYKRPS